MGIPLLGRLPLDPTISELADQGRLEEYRSDEVEGFVAALLGHVSDFA
jgi:hypothetical protein